MKILDDLNNDYEIINYINSPPTTRELQSLSDKLGLRARDFIRSNEGIFKELDLKPHLDDDKTLFKFMSENPKLIERPIIVKGEKAIIGRPPEKIIDLLTK